MEVRKLIDDIYDHICLPRPQEILEFSTLDEAFGEFEVWSKRVDRVMTCFWSYQFPMVVPGSYWRAYHLKKDGYRLDVVRTPNDHGCFVYGKHIFKEKAPQLTQEIYDQLCNEMRQIEFEKKFDVLVGGILDRYEREIGFFDKMMAAEDPTCQMGVDDFIFLASFEWLQQELWLLGKCNSDYGIPINQGMWNTLRGISNSKKLFLTFTNLVVVAGVT